MIHIPSEEAIIFAIPLPVVWLLSSAFIWSLWSDITLQNLQPQVLSDSDLPDSSSQTHCLTDSHPASWTNAVVCMPDTTETHGSHFTVPVDTCPSPGSPCWEILNSPYVLNFNKKQPPRAMGMPSPSLEIQVEKDLVKRKRKTPSRLYSHCCQSPSAGLTKLMLANLCLQCC